MVTVGRRAADESILPALRRRLAPAERLVQSLALRSARRGAPAAAVAEPVRRWASALLSDAAVPVMLPWPLPDGWLLTGFAVAGDERSGWRGLRGRAVRTEPGRRTAARCCWSPRRSGSGWARYCAGLDGPDPGDGLAAACRDARVEFGNHEFPLWHVDAPDRAAFAGEVLGRLAVDPALAGHGRHHAGRADARCVDLRDGRPGVRSAVRCPSPRLPGRAA